MKAAHQRFRLRDDVARAVRILALWICLATVACLSAGCERSRDGEASNQASEAISKDRIWSFMINDSTPSARIRKWNKQELRGLMIIDQNRAAFFQQFSPLVRQIGDEIDIKIDACEAIMRPGEVLPPGPGCEWTSFDFYFVITNGTWTESEWHQVQIALQGEASKLLVDLRKVVAAVPGGEEHTCRTMLEYSHQVSNQIEHAVAIIDSKQALVVGKCGTYLFLNMLGLYPFDGVQPLDPATEAGSLAAFLVKRAPYGGAYLLQLLYSPEVKPGMRKAEFIETLPE